MRTTGQTPSHVSPCNGDMLPELSGVPNSAASTPKPSNAADPQRCFNQWVPSLIPPMPMSLPQADIVEKFNGDLMDYPEFVQRFKTFIESQCTTDYQKLTCLRRYLGTEPAELIHRCHMYADKTKAYRMAWERWNNTYGRTKCLKDKVKAELFKGLAIHETDYEALHKVKTYMDHFHCFFDSSGHLDQLNNEDVIHPILNRLPRSLRWKYAEKCAKNGGEETYEDFAGSCGRE